MTNTESAQHHQTRTQIHTNKLKKSQSETNNFTTSYKDGPHLPEGSNQCEW